MASFDFDFMQSWYCKMEFPRFICETQSAHFPLRKRFRLGGLMGGDL